MLNIKRKYKTLHKIIFVLLMLVLTCTSVYAAGAPDPAKIDSSKYKPYSNNVELVTAKDGTSCYVYRNTGYDFSKEFPVQEIYNQGEEAQMSNLKKMYQTFISWGMTREGASAICGNIMLESNADPSRIKWDWNNWSDLFHDCGNGEWGMGASEGIGIIQFTDPSWIYALACLAATKGVTIADLGVQLLVLNYADGPMYNELYGKDIKKDECMQYFYIDLDSTILGLLDTAITLSPYSVSYDKNNKVDVLTAYYMITQERPSYENHHLESRIDYARQVYEQCKDLEGVDYSEANAKVSDSDKKKTDDAKVSIRIKNEWELKGMPKKSSLTDDYNKVTTATRSDLTTKEAVNIVDIGNNIQQSKQIDMLSTARTALVFFGLVLMIYAILLSLALLFDNINSFIDISLISVLTLGILHYSKDEYIAEEGVKYIGTKRMIVLISVIFIFAGALISGGILPTVYKGIYSIINTVSSWF